MTTDGLDQHTLLTVRNWCALRDGGSSDDRADMAFRVISRLCQDNASNASHAPAAEVPPAPPVAIAHEAVDPIPMVLHCPVCRHQHIDGPGPDDWTNPPHKSHLCHRCNCIWRPADVPTTGVADTQSHGSADTYRATPTASDRPVECNACDWRGPVSETVMLGSISGSIGPLCPKCHETTMPSDRPVVRAEDAPVVLPEFPILMMAMLEIHQQPMLYAEQVEVWIKEYATAAVKADRAAPPSGDDRG